jgi:hypothetical protein
MLRPELGADPGKFSVALMRGSNLSGDPQVLNLFEVIAYLHRIDGTIRTVVGRKAA